MVDFRKTNPSSNFQDRTGRSLMETQIRDVEDSLTTEELALMKKNNWKIQDIVIIRGLQKVMAGEVPARAPDAWYREEQGLNN